MQIPMPNINDSSEPTRWAGKEPRNKNRFEPSALAMTSAGDWVVVIHYRKDIGRYVCGLANGQGPYFRVSPADLKPIGIEKKQ